MDTAARFGSAVRNLGARRAASWTAVDAVTCQELATAGRTSGQVSADCPGLAALVFDPNRLEEHSSKQGVRARGSRQRGHVTSTYRVLTTTATGSPGYPLAVLLPS